ncbi:unnamed protein product [Lymnaea stagnalis]|uniref:C-type lectin domain-containing protein n=1 Tax=Lymnaea stagnalis TaxID=6523 RepID=A0AAV2II81_LYMST
MMETLLLISMTLLLFASKATGLQFNVQPTKIEIGLSTRFDIVCSFNHGTDNELSSLVSLIVSRSKNTTYEDYRELASVDALSGHVTVMVQSNATISGAINNRGVSYLKMEWKFPDDEVSGLYKCLANGVDGSGHPIGVVSTNQVTSEIPDVRQLVNVVHDVLINMDSALGNMCISGCWQSRLEQMRKARFVISSLYNGHRYLLSKTASLASVAVAQESCELYGGYLAEIYDDFELLFIQNFIKSPPGIDYTMVLIGGTDYGHKNHWVYDRNQRNVTYTKWIPGKPSTTANYNCLYLAAPTWAMSNYICFEVTRTYNTRYLCEVPEE